MKKIHSSRFHCTVISFPNVIFSFKMYNSYGEVIAEGDVVIKKRSDDKFDAAVFNDAALEDTEENREEIDIELDKLIDRCTECADFIFKDSEKE